MGDEQEAPIVPAPHSNSPSISRTIEERKPLSKTLKILTVIAIVFGNIALGLSINSYDPVITSMQIKYQQDESTLSIVFTILSVGYMLGALAGGVIFNYVNRQKAVIILLTAMAVMMFLTPLCPTMTLFFISAGVNGLAVGAYDTAQIVWMMEMMQKDCPPYLQMQHFCYALGTTLTSFIMAPFLDERRHGGDNSTTTNGTDHNIFDDTPEFIDGSPTKFNKHSGKLFVPFTIIGCVILVVAIVQILLYVFLRYHPPPPEVFEDQASESKPLLGGPEKNGYLMSRRSWRRLRIIVLSCCYYGAYQGMEMCNFQLFPEFAQYSDLRLSEEESSYVLSGMTMGFTVGRALAIIMVFKIPCKLILCGNILLVIIANIILVGWASSSLTCLWASSIIFGLGFSSQYGSISAYMERYMEFTNFVGALMIVSGTGVASVYPLVVGVFIKNNPIVLSYTSWFSIFWSIFSLGSLSYLTHKDKTRY